MGDTACSTVELAEQPMVRHMGCAGVSLDRPLLSLQFRKWNYELS